MIMKIKKEFMPIFQRGAGALLCTVTLFASCRDDLEATIPSGEGIHFSVSEDSDWRITRGSASRMEEEPSLQDSLLGCCLCRQRMEATAFTCTPS